MIDFPNVRRIVTPKGEIAMIARGAEILFQAQRYKRELLDLESTGTQWIDTRYAFADDFTWEIDFEGMNTGATLFGGRTSAARTAVLYYGNAQSNNGVPFLSCSIAGYTGANTPFKLGALSDGRHIVKMSVNSNKGSVWMDGVQMYADKEFPGSYISKVTQAIFADNYGNGRIEEYASSKVYGSKMWQGETLVRDFIPVIDNNDVPCMYDKVTGELFYNQGTGEFLYVGDT